MNEADIEATTYGQRDYSHYSMILEWDPVDRIFVVTIPELPGCRTHGKTYEEAVQQGQYAFEGWVEAAHAWNHPIPSAAYFDINSDSIITHNASKYGDIVDSDTEQSKAVGRRSA